MVSLGNRLSLCRGSRRRRNAAGYHSRGRWAVVCRARQRPLLASATPRWKYAKLGHRLETGAPIGQLPWARSLRTGCSVYIDHFGNAMTGLRVAQLPRVAKLIVAGRVLEPARTFSDRQPGMAFWYENSNGLAEIAVNQKRADRELGLSIGVPVEIVP